MREGRSVGKEEGEPRLLKHSYESEKLPRPPQLLRQ